MEVFGRAALQGSELRQEIRIIYNQSTLEVDQRSPLQNS